MTQPLLPHIEINPTQTPIASVIWLHGLGADGHDFEPIIPMLNLPEHLAIRFVLPHAPKIPVSINGGLSMPAWYDIKATDLRDKQDQSGILKSVSQIDALIQQEIKDGINPENIYLAGFSQGGAIILYTALTSQLKLGGIIALSTYLPLINLLDIPDNKKNIPVFMGHGIGDPVIPYQTGLSAKQQIEKHVQEVNWFKYDMEHSVCNEEINDISLWLDQQISKINAKSS